MQVSGLFHIAEVADVEYEPPAVDHVTDTHVRADDTRVVVVVQHSLIHEPVDARLE
ncbi:hypothetical protein ACKI1O_43595 [Streptomyces scabiei]